VKLHHRQFLHWAARAAIALSAIALIVAPASASETLDAMRTVWRFVGSFNKGDVNAALGECAAQSSIIDEFPPYLWQGATGCADWANDFDAYIKKNGMTGPKVTLGLLRHVDVSGDRAYVVVPANFTFKKNGRRFNEPSSMWTVTLQKIADSWRITGWAWAKH
jgi:ketosteroid isomerase-like protein